MPGEAGQSAGGAVHIVVPEGLARPPGPRRGRADEARPPSLLSDYYLAAVEAVARLAPLGAEVLMAPGNAFGARRSEEQTAARVLRRCRGDLRVRVAAAVRPPGGSRYLDTFDNALLLRRWLARRGRWPIGQAVLYCNAPHAVRCRAVFALCGFRLRRLVPCRPTRRRRRIVRRLWYYDRRPVHVLYEAGALLYDLARWLVRQLRGE